MPPPPTGAPSRSASGSATVSTRAGRSSRAARSSASRSPSPSSAAPASSSSTNSPRAWTGARVLVLTTYDSDADTLPAIEAGATGYLLKDAPREELFAAVRATAAGRSVLAPAVASRLVTSLRAPAADEAPPRTALSAREREVLALVARGTPNREIARLLFLSEATVKTHLTHLYAKLGATDRAAAVARGYERGILGTGSAGT
ncbi:LuxR C-terminal-related transcriptional regulator [Streptomyces sp. NPDC088923]|uniref:LuxR C-terminal-related transcriptional regulator n=1 Tax=Streptomyces sp. NPDC088923 TaxID=3365913 RepID=UPI00382925BD